MNRDYPARALREAKRLGHCLLILFLGLAAAGCGSATGQVTGKVIFRGKPLSGGAVSFLPASGQGANTSRIKEDGTYTVIKVPVGTVKIVVAPPAAAKLDPKIKMMVDAVKSGKTKMSQEEIDKMPPEFREALDSGGPSSSGRSGVIPKQYTDPEKSVLEYTVTSGSQIHDIELK
jgi:hypothetical protein